MHLGRLNDAKLVLTLCQHLMPVLGSSPADQGNVASFSKGGGQFASIKLSSPSARDSALMDAVYFRGDRFTFDSRARSIETEETRKSNLGTDIWFAESIICLTASSAAARSNARVNVGDSTCPCSLQNSWDRVPL